jgi:hypothetical protein
MSDLEQEAREAFLSKCVGKASGVGECQGDITFHVGAPKLDTLVQEEVRVSVCGSPEHLGMVVDGLSRHPAKPDILVTRVERARSPLDGMLQRAQALMAQLDQERAQARVRAAEEAGVEPDQEDVEVAADSGPQGYMAVEILGSEDTHAARPGGVETFCGRRVDFPAGKVEPTCGVCRVAVGMVQENEERPSE